MRETYTDPEVLPIEILCSEQTSWETIAPGFEVTEYIIEDFQVQWACVRIDLDTPGIQITGTPQKHPNKSKQRLEKMNLNKLANLPQDSITTSVVVNTTPFNMRRLTYPPVSIVRFDNKDIYALNEEYCALALARSQDGIRAAIIKNQNEEELLQYQYAFGGFSWILDEEEIPPFGKFKRSRTACGISDQGRFLYLFAACGINCPTGRDGLNFEECALILKHLGCTQAMEFDGGHSSGLVVNGQNKIKPSLQRRVPATLCLYLAN